jgi:hypothetical protein
VFYVRKIFKSSTKNDPALVEKEYKNANRDTCQNHQFWSREANICIATDPRGYEANVAGLMLSPHRIVISKQCRAAMIANVFEDIAPVDIIFSLETARL